VNDIEYNGSGGMILTLTVVLLMLMEKVVDIDPIPGPSAPWNNALLRPAS
jgi:hypothetical protein